jgi:hypothetical protein
MESILVGRRAGRAPTHRRTYPKTSGGDILLDEMAASAVERDGRCLEPDAETRAGIGVIVVTFAAAARSNVRFGGARIKWIDELETAIGEVTNVSGGHGQFVSCCNRSYLTVQRCHGTAQASPVCQDIRVFVGCAAIEWKDTVFEAFGNEALEPALEILPPASIRKYFKAVLDFGDGHC